MLFTPVGSTNALDVLDGAVVITDRVEVAAVLLLRLTDDGEKLHVAPGKGALQDSDTVLA